MSVHSLSRRNLLQVGALSLCGGLAASAAEDAKPSKKRRQCIFILLQGGPSHHDLWDPKPQASEEIRGPFRIIDTPLGVPFGEIVPHTANVADRLCLVRSMTHQFNNHIAGTYIALTGSTNQQNNDREAHSDDFPGPGAILNVLERSAPSVPR